jgi:hypothetical protein
MWVKPLSEIISILPAAPYQEQQEFNDLAARLDTEIKEHAPDLASYRKTYRDEITGALDASRELILDVLDGMAEKAGKATLIAGSPEQIECVRVAQNIFIAAFDAGKAQTILRTIHALACLHAGLRWNRRTTFEGNHLYDFAHAAGAVAYCDAFFTEGFLANLINAGHIQLDTLNGCRTTSKVEEAVAILRDLLPGIGT